MTQDIAFSWYWDGRENALILSAKSGGETIGSVTVQGRGQDQVAVGRLYVEPAWRRQNVARRLMLHVLAVCRNADKWLYATPFTKVPGEAEGLPREVLERFYASLGYKVALDGAGRRAMVLSRSGALNGGE